MLTPSPEIIQVLTAFAPALTQPAWRKCVLLICGAILAPGRRTVTAALGMVGLADAHFTNYHRLLNRDRWSALLLSRLLLALLVAVFLPAEAPLVLLIDETLERRRG